MTRKEAKRFSRVLKDALKGKAVLKRDCTGEWVVYHDLMCREALCPSDYKRIGKVKKKSKTMSIAEAEAFLGKIVRDNTTGKLYRVFNVYDGYSELFVYLSDLGRSDEVKGRIVVSITSFISDFTVMECSRQGSVQQMNEVLP